MCILIIAITCIITIIMRMSRRFELECSPHHVGWLVSNLEHSDGRGRECLLSPEFCCCDTSNTDMHAQVPHFPSQALPDGM